MRTPHSVLAAAAIALASPAFAAVQVSNFGEYNNLGGFILPGTNMGTSFTTGPGDYWSLNSIRGYFYSFTGIEQTLTLKIYADNGGLPGTLVTTLPTRSISSLGYADVTFSTSLPTLLLPLTTYWLIAENAPDYSYFLGTDSTFESSPSGWTIGDYAVRGRSGDWLPTQNTINCFEIDADNVTPPLQITAVSGCNDAPPITRDCPSNGGIFLTIDGLSFTPTTRVLIAGIPSGNPVFVTPSRIDCILPPGVGRNNAVTVVDGEMISFLPAGVSYIAPACAGDADGNGAVNFADITSVLGNFGAACP